jgi:hypothetical protein
MKQKRDMMEVTDIADEYGLNVKYVSALTGPTNRHRDVELFRLRVGTDESYRKVFESRAKYVYPRTDVKRWHRERSQRPRVISARNKRHE